MHIHIVLHATHAARHCAGLAVALLLQDAALVFELPIDDFLAGFSHRCLETSELGVQLIRQYEVATVTRVRELRRDIPQRLVQRVRVVGHGHRLLGEGGAHGGAKPGHYGAHKKEERAKEESGRGLCSSVRPARDQGNVPKSEKLATSERYAGTRAVPDCGRLAIKRRGLL